MLFLFFLLLVADSLADMDGEVDLIVWTSQPQSELLTEQQHKIAFKDVILEKVIRRSFSVYMNSCQSYQPRIQKKLLLKDPWKVEDLLEFDKEQAGLVNIHFKAWDLELHGLHQIKLKNIHVLRHIGLKDLRLVAQVESDMKLTGFYNVTGTGLSMVPLTGSGQISVSISSLMLTGETFLVVRENPDNGQMELHVKELEVKMTHSGLNVQLENLMGGGLVGAAGNDVLTMVGEDVLFNHKDKLAAKVKENFRSELSKYLEMTIA